jgi:hypothetical protein
MINNCIRLTDITSGGVLFFGAPSLLTSIGVCPGDSSIQNAEVIDWSKHKKATIEPAESVLENYFRNYYLGDQYKVLPFIDDKHQIMALLPADLNFENRDKVLNFMSEYKDSLPAILSIIDKIKHDFDPDAALSLSLSEEGEDWKTLFVEVDTQKPWEAIRVFREAEWMRLEHEHPEVANFINFQFY